MSLKIALEPAKANPITILEHIYNPNVSYLPGPIPHKEKGEIVYTHASPPQKYHANPHQVPHSPHVQLNIRFKDHVYTRSGTLIGSYHVLTNSAFIYDPHDSFWADEVILTDFYETCHIVKVYIFTQLEQKDFRYDIALLILSKALGKYTGWSGLLAVSDGHLQQEKIQITGHSSKHTLHKIESERLYYTPALADPQPESALWVSGWKTSMIVGLESHGKDEKSFAIRLTKQKIEALSQKIAENFEKFPLIPFGKAQWAQHFGDVGVESPLPPNIKKILKAPCPIWEGKKVYETHLLTLKNLGKLVQKPLQGPATKYRYFGLGKYNDQPNRASHWTLLSRDVIPGSQNQPYSDQRKLMKKYQGYEAPSILDATVSIFMEHVRTGNRVYSDNPYTYTRCQETWGKDRQLVIGGFAAGGLDVGIDIGYYGVGVQRKFS